MQINRGSLVQLNHPVWPQNFKGTKKSADEHYKSADGQMID
jgi:hypothetical protein